MKAETTSTAGRRSGLMLLGVCVALVMAGCSDTPRTDKPGIAPKSDAPPPSTQTSLATNSLAPLPEPTGVDTPLVQLGKQLFHTPALSGDQTVSCATCHIIDAGGDDGLSVSFGVGGAAGEMNAPTVLNAALNLAQFWDGRAASLADQIDGPIENKHEMASDWPTIEQRLRDDAQWRQAFADAGLPEISKNTIKAALVAYEAVLVTPNAPFDRYLQGEDDALSATAREGYRHFTELGCVSCHQGRNIGGNLFQRFGIYRNFYEDQGKTADRNLGRFNVTGDEADRYVFRVPSLRNIALTAPYFHDGSVASLEEAVQIMAEYQLGTRLEPDQVRALVAFLESLTGEVPEALQ